ncbi:MAG: orotidine-5'-phosphate decarboxylase [Flammeovirgaceae bacterium]|jgi:orotidine-5'-phosphate decarboxylase|nr:orotidine-5'-phosphate decarboxylase [Flammeovirgaceae bacterium]|tara:strand:- start:2880 stop:3704 length:825 start_codon:yes stop_codon:yes gene_type:complete
MTEQQLFEKIKTKKSLLCVGLDPDLDKMPKHLLEMEDPIFEFNKAIIDATLPFAIAYKPNTAFYESLGVYGWQALKKTIDYLPKDVFTIADAKRGDIGNTSNKYASAFFKEMDFDAITVSPYMGEDSVKPFLNHKGKWVILLASTSNAGSLNFQELTLADSKQKLYERVIEVSAQWGSEQNMMYVIGATRTKTLSNIREVLPNHFLLIPGIGAQGGDLNLVCKTALNHRGGLLINSARNIIYANDGIDFAQYAAKAAEELQQAMSQAIERYKKW